MKVYQVRYNNGESCGDSHDHEVATYLNKEDAEKHLDVKSKRTEALLKEYQEFCSLDELCRPQYPPQHLEYFNPDSDYYIREIDVLDKYVEKQQ